MRQRKWGNVCLKVSHNETNVSKRLNSVNSSDHRFQGKGEFDKRLRLDGPRIRAAISPWNVLYKTKYYRLVFPSSYTNLHNLFILSLLHWMIHYEYVHNLSVHRRLSLYLTLLFNSSASAGLKESPRMSLADSVLLTEIMDEIRKQVGVVFGQDSQWHHFKAELFPFTSSKPTQMEQREFLDVGFRSLE